MKRIKIANEDIVWGYLCGRDDSSDGSKSRHKSRFDLLSNRRRIFNPPKIADQQSDSLPEKKLKSFLSELKKIDIHVSLEKLKQIDFDFSLEKLKQLNMDISLDKVKQLFSLNLLSLRHRIFTLTQDDIQPHKSKNELTIGIPNTLNLIEYVPFWQLFFKKLGYTVKLSSAKTEFLESGKEIAGAEFCTPISYWHGHVKNLSDCAIIYFCPIPLQAANPIIPNCIAIIQTMP